MSFAVALEPDARKSLAALLPEIAELVLDEIDRLAVSPGTAGGVRLPYMKLGLSFTSRRKFAGATDQIQITYQYGQDEETLHILNIAVNPA